MSNRSTTAISGLLLALLGAWVLTAPAASAQTVDAVVEQLVEQAEASNLELAGVEAGVAQRQAVLDQARARFLPAVDLGLRYSRADGGRQIDFPVGDLFNPVYASLNSLLAANGQPAPFTPIDNVSIPFLREREQQSAVTMTQPLFDARISAAARAAKFDYQGSRQGLEAFRIRLRRDVQQAYLGWLATRESKAILEASLEAALENQRVNTSLYRNGRITRDFVLRAEADVLEIEQQIESTGGAERIAQNYVNLLRNTPLDAPLPQASVSDDDVIRLRDVLIRQAGSVARDRGWLQDTAIDRRYELKQIDSGLAAAGAAEDLARAAFKPQLALAVDAGIQGEDYGFTADDRYVLASLVLRFNFYNGGADRASLRQARARSDELRAARELAEQQIRLEVLQAAKDFEVAEASLRTAAKRVEAAEGAFEIARRKRDLGQIPQVEFIDSRRAVTSAQLNQRVNRFQALSALAAVEYAVGGPARGASGMETAP
jgi:outer membrane protein TolC